MFDYIVNKEKRFNARNILLDKEIKPSYQRIKLLEYMYFNRIHPSVDMIYKDLKLNIPTLSKTTIYNIVNLFIEKDLVHPIKLNENELRFDIKTKPHAHFYCKSCNNLYDVNINNEYFNIKEINGNMVNSTHIGFIGICKKCKNKINND